MPLRGRDDRQHGERRDEEPDDHHSELRFGVFDRRIPLPKGCASDDINASYAAGVLTVVLPAEDEAPEPVRVPIARADD